VNTNIYREKERERKKRGKQQEEVKGTHKNQISLNT